jgi:NAD(P)-dependent dehydrogenase (short-subunit alcohol dehydrogenase family)
MVSHFKKQTKGTIYRKSGMVQDIFRRYDLSGQTSVITGGSSGIGKAIAIDFAKFGSNVVIVDIASGEETIEEIKRIGRRALYIKADVSDHREVKKATEGTLDRFGAIDILVNAAGILTRHKVTETAEIDWDRIIGINLKGVFLCCQSVASFMIKRRNGKIINLGSASSRGPVFNVPQGGAGYCVSKSGVHALTRVFAWELAPYGINVNTVAPGPVETPMHKGEMRMIRKKYKDKIPMGQLAKAEDIAAVATFLATDAAHYITGQAVHVNGGMLMVD